MLDTELRGVPVVVMSNREPWVHERGNDGVVRARQPIGGLVTALEPVVRACRGLWVAHGSGSGDRATSDQRGRVRVPEDASDGERYTLRRVWLSDAEYKGYYEGYANEGLWPLCHVAHERPVFRSDDYAAWLRVNERFADAVAAEARRDDPVVLVQDYHLAMAPRFLRERLPKATIVSFWHIPWPNAERYAINPWSGEVLEGLLASDVVGFHTQGHCNHFLAGVSALLEARVDHEDSSVVMHGHRTRVRPWPISIAWPDAIAAVSPPPRECRRALLDRYGLPDDAVVGVGVDRLDYTKGIEERLLAVERMLEQHSGLRGRFYFVQVAAPSRTNLPAYRALTERVETLAAAINERFGEGGVGPVILVREAMGPRAVYELYRAADLCYVSSLHDGMNLVAKEFVAARDDLRGVLVLSRFTGAARELGAALVVNPYHIDEAAHALLTAVEMPAHDQAARMTEMRRVVSEENVWRWAGRMLTEAARVRREKRIAPPGELARVPAPKGDA
ncbi:MAG: trehalose-6-phosphate synthase [Polyangiales bacterium]